MKLRCSALLILGIVFAQVAWAEDPTSLVRFSVVRDYNGKPVRNASVILHPVNKKGLQERSGLQLKTDGDGNTSFDGVPYGPLRIQVLAQGFQTYGEDFDISKPETQITIKLKRPQQQYSVYDGTPGAGQSTPPPQTETKPDEKKNGTTSSDSKPEAPADSKQEKPQ